MCAVLFICWSLVASSQISVKLQGTRHHFRCECDTVYIRDDDTQRVDATNMYVTEEMLHEYSRSASAQLVFSPRVSGATVPKAVEISIVTAKLAAGNATTAPARTGRSERLAKVLFIERILLGRTSAVLWHLVLSLAQN